MSRFGLAFSVLVMVALASAAYPVLSRGVNAGRLLAARDDPAQLTELGLDDRFDAARAAREIDAALAANDPELADSFVELARERAIAIDADRLAAVESAKKAAASAAKKPFSSRPDAPRAFMIAKSRRRSYTQPMSVDSTQREAVRIMRAAAANNVARVLPSTRASPSIIWRTGRTSAAGICSTS